MKMRATPNHLLGTASALALAVTAIVGAAAPQPAAAAQGVYGGGSTLLSLSARQIFDCYHGVTLPSDGYSFSSSFPTPGALPTTCTVGALSTVEGLYAGVGSGSGLRGFIANDPHLLLQSPNSGLPATFPLPANPPVYVDGTGAAPFGLYPYPELDFAASDSPLPSFTVTTGSTLAAANSLTTVSYSSFTPTTNWQGLAGVTAAASTTVNYSTAKYGQPIQIPAAEVPVAIAVNVATTTAATWTIRSALSPNTQAGGAIQLSSAQLCAIFSGAVRDWSASSAILIANLTSSGGVATVGSQAFNADNTNATTHTGTPYTSGSLPITVAYRSDGSGTSFIITNYLAAVCPLLDNGTNNYTKIFTGVGATYPSGVESITVNGATVNVTKTSSSASNLPSTSFVNLIANIKAVTGTDVSTSWVGASGSGAVAAAINNNSANSGRIGYLSNDFTAAYSASTTAPLSASIQDEHLRASGVNHPGDSGTIGSAQNFIAPTPTNGNIAWTHLAVPAATATYNDWNVYNQVFPSTTPTSGGLTLSGKFILPLDYTLNAYPITGTTFLELYSCYADNSTSTRVSAVANFVSWLIDGSAAIGSGTPSTSTAASPQYDPDVGRVIQNNGFHQISATLAKAILKQYVTPPTSGHTAIAAYNTSGSQTEGCTGVTGGAN
jgi:ABC-type phosphate transport system substrate-binding protein